MLLSDLLAGLSLLDVSLVENRQVRGIAYDSRQVERDFLFIAIKGFKTDGHLFVPDAVERGACAVILQEAVPVPEGISWALVVNTRKAMAQMSARFYDYPARKMKMVGVTGTNGKTTTANLINAIYRKHRMKTGLIGTIHNCIGERILPVDHTTPESADLQQLLAEMAAEQVQAVVMEVSSHALVLNRVEECFFDTAVFTNLTQDHLDFHGNMQQYREAKSLLFAGLEQNDYNPGRKWAVVNVDDPAAEQIMAACHVPVMRYGLKQDADIKARDVRVTARGVAFQAVTTVGKIDLQLHLTGMFNVYNALAAVAVGVADNIPLSTIKNALEQVTGVPGRFELVDRGQPFAVVVDYAHTPDGLENVLTTARDITTGRLITVFGCGGDRDRAKRPMMGEIAARMSDMAVVTSDNPRSEEPLNIIEDILAGVRRVKNALFTVVPDRREAIRQAICSAAPGDVVLIAGKGHEDYQIIGSRRLHFDDREEAIAALGVLKRM
ncbi:UDP-N-acetylmuramoyl-L-alanyl-D-glutamate--L-lysine ligase [Sporotomaculum syntrophicum]|uniref:UDP-N-acetylmuramoyl-L-alanyl-D-glutamate--2,6-diaminopimelate ligase n=1 Tax=Sporotomaculum syntrophicum TaxID=182264 RepID=A0A9D3AXW8_9FIRM|nr:UDP-N-acetylmuramoyl-L-alanyl-D-glutamate--2,6-diaminopimelate ligase [Sporotomaculum syntrophicum]KAF1084866.1 UDP-N-acetylmuramoyl-L-alanyl-D-glutamate--L-lysine ligase [Sporotomaculum syntrophicum]